MSKRPWTNTSQREYPSDKQKMCSTSMAIREIHIKTLWDTIYPTEWPKLEGLIIPSVGEEVSNWNSQSLPMRALIHSTNWRKSLTVSNKAQDIHTLWASKSTCRYLPFRKVYLHTPRLKYKNICSSVICNSPVYKLPNVYQQKNK